jgi:hypothetical protein
MELISFFVVAAGIPLLYFIGLTIANNTFMWGDKPNRLAGCIFFAWILLAVAVAFAY